MAKLFFLVVLVMTTGCKDSATTHDELEVQRCVMDDGSEIEFGFGLPDRQIEIDATDVSEGDPLVVLHRGQVIPGSSYIEIPPRTVDTDVNEHGLDSAPDYPVSRTCGTQHRITFGRRPAAESRVTTVTLRADREVRWELWRNAGTMEEIEEAALNSDPSGWKLSKAACPECGPDRTETSAELVVELTGESAMFVLVDPPSNLVGDCTPYAHREYLETGEVDEHNCRGSSW